MEVAVSILKRELEYLEKRIDLKKEHIIQTKDMLAQEETHLDILTINHGQILTAIHRLESE